jgi:predicted MPP superfamily phosphohydrolase
LRTGHHLTTTAWLIAFAVNGAFYFWTGWMVSLLWQWAARGPAGPPEAGDAAPNTALLSRRQLLRSGMKVLGGSAAVGLGYALVGQPRWFVVDRRTIGIRGLPQPLDGLRVVQLTDIHHGPWLSLGYVRQVVQTTNELRPDLVLLTGDYVSSSAADIRPVIEELARLQPRIKILAVLGNHDWWEDGPHTQRQFCEAGIAVIDNARRIVTPDRRIVPDAREGLAIGGVGDLWTDRQDYQRALGGLPAAMPRLLLSHNPDVAEEQELVGSGLRVDLMISGHTHGGQIALPGLGAPLCPSRYGQKYAQGLVQGPVCAVFICRGIGVSLLPVRIGTSPEIAVLELKAAAS